MPADVIVHADWSVLPRKRWAATAVRGEDGRYEAHAPQPADDALSAATADRGRTALAGFDVVIGLPRAYADAVGAASFREFLRWLASGEWDGWFEVAERSEEVSLRRPFYPRRPGGASKHHLTDGLGLGELELFRRCEQPTPHRPGGAELFWTIGGKQVGKASLAMWREVLLPWVDGGARLWPYGGALADLLDDPGVVVAETYPAEAAVHAGVALRGSKRDQQVRAAGAGALLAYAARVGFDVAEPLRVEVAEGFGDDATGEDRFDAVLGLFGMLGVVLGARDEGAPRDDPAVTSVEGWILGLDPADVDVPVIEPAPPPRGPRFVVARNPNTRSTLPYLLSLPVHGGPLLLAAREPWPRTSKVYCHPIDVWPADAEVVEELGVVVCERRGKAIDLVVDRAREKRSQFVFVTARGREMIFWQTAKTTKQSRPGVRIPSRRASGQDELRIVADTRERYGYRFSSQQAEVAREALPVGDYGVRVGARVVAAVERKSVDDLVARLVDGKLAFTLAELGALDRAAVVVEGSYAELFKLEHVKPGFVADQLARIQVRYPTVPIVFCGTRKLGEEWTYRFLGAARAEAEGDLPRYRRPDAPAED